MTDHLSGPATAPSEVVSRPRMGEASTPARDDAVRQFARTAPPLRPIEGVKPRRTNRKHPPRRTMKALLSQRLGSQPGPPAELRLDTPRQSVARGGRCKASSLPWCCRLRATLNASADRVP